MMQNTSSMCNAGTVAQPAPLTSSPSCSCSFLYRSASAVTAQSLPSQQPQALVAPRAPCARPLRRLLPRWPAAAFVAAAGRGPGLQPLALLGVAQRRRCACCCHSSRRACECCRAFVRQ
jgi:hypothetical protein